jgi:hypothetical protein
MRYWKIPFHRFIISHIHPSYISICHICLFCSLFTAANQAIEHEARCAEAFAASTKKSSSSLPSSSASVSAASLTANDSSSSSNKVKSKEERGVLQYWGSVADVRWRELYEMACAEVMVSPVKPAALNASGGSGKEKEGMGKKGMKRMKPLLLFLPSHIQPSPLGAYRSIHLACRYFC